LGLKLFLKGNLMNRRFSFCIILLNVLGLIAATLVYWGCGDVSPKPNVLSDKPEKPQQAKLVKLKTNMGDIVIALEEKAAPVTAANFLRYVEEGFYDGIVFHRVIAGFMIQTGGFDQDLSARQPHEPVVNEYKISNTRATVAMAKKGGNPDSATSQFFINVSDNSKNLDNQNGGFTVFAKVVKGMDVVDKIAAVKTTIKTATNRGRKFSMRDVPADSVVIKSAKVVHDN